MRMCPSVCTSPGAQSWGQAWEQEQPGHCVLNGDSDGTRWAQLRTQHSLCFITSPLVFQNLFHFVRGDRCEGLAGSHSLLFWEKKKIFCVPFSFYGGPAFFFLFFYVLFKGVIVLFLETCAHTHTHTHTHSVIASTLSRDRCLGSALFDLCDLEQMLHLL